MTVSLIYYFDFTITNKNVAYHKHLYLQQRFELVTKSDTIILATLLDPRFKDKFIPEDQRHAAIGTLKQKMNFVNNENRNPNTQNTSCTPNSNNSKSSQP